jgi:hypothetical protein
MPFSIDDAVVTLYRPVGPDELRLIREAGWSMFPPRLPGQEIFYPVVNEDYAIQIASRWNVRTDGSGYVTRFQVRKSYLDLFESHQVGGTRHREYWIPADQLPEFNGNIVGKIEVVGEFLK